jgi:hypothetical protein
MRALLVLAGGVLRMLAAATLRAVVAPTAPRITAETTASAAERRMEEIRVTAGAWRMAYLRDGHA